MTTKPRHYVPDLQLLSSLTEANYARLQKLIPEQEAGRRHVYQMSLGDEEDVRISVTIEEVHRYTSMLLVEQKGANHQLVPPPVMKVRMYHDAQMAEVIGFQSQRVSEGRYPYPNRHMRHPDEKTQLNRFLADWLEHCVRHGRADAASVPLAFKYQR